MTQLIKAILPVSLLLFTACATPTSFSEATQSQYVGNGQYEISASGNELTSAAAVRHFLYRKAFTTCAKQNKGFRIISKENDSSSETAVKRVGSDIEVSTSEFPGARMVIACDGPVDKRLEAELKQQRKKFDKVQEN